MAYFLKMDIAAMISKCIVQDANHIAAAMKILPSAQNDYIIHVKYDEFEQAENRFNDINSISKIKNQTPICDIAEYKQGYNLKIDPTYFVKNILINIVQPRERTCFPKKIIIEYSSPNIAKPFHVGHLRSTIIGQYLVNANKYLGENVKSLNYLGDWGTQFGLLKKGINILNRPNEIKENPIKYLYDAYVEANKQAETNPAILDEARQNFSKMEMEDDNIDEWKTIRDLTVSYLSSVYERIGVRFDEYNWESMYRLRDIKSVLQTLEINKIIQADKDGRKYVELNGDEVTLVKTDGSALYLTRDIAAALDRYDRHKFDEMVYVADSSQAKHFKSLFTILEKMRAPFVKHCKFVPFGRIIGMSTRKGTVVFLNEILDEAKDKMHQNRLQSPNTRGSIKDEKVADILGISALKIYDLKQSRRKNYNFDWNLALQNDGDTGVKMQYVHCRLYSIEKNSGVPIPVECIPEYLTDNEAVSLIQHLSIFDETVEKASSAMEPCVLVLYLFRLCKKVNKAIKVLRVKGESPDLASQRLLLFHAARLTLKRGLEILGITPLNEM